MKRIWVYSAVEDTERSAQHQERQQCKMICGYIIRFTLFRLINPEMVDVNLSMLQ